MKKYLSVAWGVVLSVASAGYVTAADLPLALVPEPAHLERTGQPYQLTTGTRIVIDEPEASRTAELLVAQLRRTTGYPLPMFINPAPLDADTRTTSTIILTTSDADPSLGREGYELRSTPAGVVIWAPYQAGLFYGTQTLRQLLPPEAEGRSLSTTTQQWLVPGVTIRDVPRFPYRGFLLDSARHLQSLEFIRRTLDLMAWHKLNTFHWHLTDDNGWRLELKNYPKLTEVGAWREKDGQRYGGFFTQEQIRELVAYAAERHITIIPEIEMPAHSTAALAAYPENACLPGPFLVKQINEPSLDVFCPGKPSTLAFLTGVLDEAITLFPSPIIHIGGDECNKTRWKHCPDCQALMKRENLADEDALQSWLTHRIAAHLRSRGRRMQGWDEILRGGNLPADVVVHQWDQPRAAVQAVRAGNDVVVSSTGWTYFDYDYTRIPLQKVYEGEPVPAELTAEESRKILGQQAQLWTELRPTEPMADTYIWPRLVALADRCWAPRVSRDWERFQSRLENGHYERLALRGLGTPNVPAETIKAHLLEPK